MDREIKRIDIWHLTRGGTQIFWELSPSFRIEGRTFFFIDFGWPGTDEWVALNEEPVVDDCWYYDECRRTWEVLREACYRVRLVLPDVEGCPVYTSQPVQANGRLDRRDWLRARDIVRREHLQQRRIDGTAGFLLKRRKFGRRCERCADFDTEEVTNTRCSNCFGVGIVGGYYPGVLFYFSDQPGWRRRIKVAEPPRGTVSDIEKGGWRCVLYPHIDTGDIWIRADCDERYRVDGYQVVAAMKGVPLIAVAQLKLIPATDIAYDVPIEAPSSSSSSASCGVRRGLAATDDDW